MVRAILDARCDGRYRRDGKRHRTMHKRRTSYGGVVAEQHSSAALGPHVRDCIAPRQTHADIVRGRAGAPQIAKRRGLRGDRAPLLSANHPHALTLTGPCEFGRRRRLRIRAAVVHVGEAPVRDTARVL